jgi:hydroxymethylpyrimidine pyrophosphatase-like HAD family hydrolase
MARAKLLAVDLDGTLLDVHGVPHERDLRALHAAAEAGAVVTIVTGRLYSGTRPTAQRVGVFGPVACADGSHLVRVRDDTTLMHLGLRGAHALAMRDGLASHGAAGFLFVRDMIVHDDAGDEYLAYVRTWSNDIRRAERLATHEMWEHEDGITACVAVGTDEQISGTYEQILERVGEAAQVTKFPIRRVDGAMWGLVARAAGGTKGSALKWLASHHGIAPDEAVCVGDWLNDIPMMREAGRAYAMGQAPEDVKKAATHVLNETHEGGGGIARVVELELGVRV